MRQCSFYCLDGLCNYFSINPSISNIRTSRREVIFSSCLHLHWLNQPTFWVTDGVMAAMFVWSYLFSIASTHTRSFFFTQNVFLAHNHAFTLLDVFTSITTYTHTPKEPFVTPNTLAMVIMVMILGQSPVSVPSLSCLLNAFIEGISPVSNSTLCGQHACHADLLSGRKHLNALGHLRNKTSY